MEEVKLYVELVGVDPASDADIRIARRESTSWHKDIVAELIIRFSMRVKHSWARRGWKGCMYMMSC